MFFVDIFDVIRDFLERGGNVLWLILFTLVLLWSLIIERFMYFRGEFPNELQTAMEEWKSRADKSSWYAQKIRQAEISLMSKRLTQNISHIKMLVALCPLLGLLGTVTGMIAVFDVMAATGTGNARLMASGISMATIPTMSGMVAALSGLYFGSLLETRAKKEQQKLADALPLH
jgi:biopolymer transport protein ExbB